MYTRENKNCIILPLYKLHFLLYIIAVFRLCSFALILPLISAPSIGRDQLSLLSFGEIELKHARIRPGLPYETCMGVEAFAVAV